MGIVTCPKCGARNRLDDRAAASQPLCGRCGTRIHVTSASADALAPMVVTDAGFAASVLGASKPVLVDCWAAWCGPCRMIAPALEELSDEFGDRVTIAKLNIDENPEAPSKYGVRGIPTMILFKNGQPAATKVGAAPKSALQSWLEGQL